ncbi:GNAT family N-acetyltransferase [Clostridium fermenticellae]|uniref:GNAT family N-acetyltransferase n=1 Tax=Clostridium fermenticellae TaxID=2068654 RepID=A0A386H3N9_9CLOT|nr:GNAT family N-acetyltransferase [Clostridium fermenticellae]AYD40300.1 GNAT family N-acetyltransferase [Clostridium fermenticellae]
MYKIMTLNKKNLNEFRKLNENNDHFNLLNMDFFKMYDNGSFTNKVFLRRRVKLLSYNFKYIGYIWCDANYSYRNVYTINAMNISNSINIELIDPYKYIVNRLKKNSTFYYTCQNNGFNFNILKNIGFETVDGTLILNLNLDHNIPIAIKEDINFDILKIGKDEKKRCLIQNEIFKNNTRVPLSLDDIYFDEMQSYYLKKGAIFIKKRNTYIGYGQIILEENVPIIVNFGILKEYRGKGYSKCLLTYLLKIVICNGFNNVKIKVNNSNYIALNLYKQMGFEIENERYKWKIKT